MSRILVVYYSRTGHTERVARQIASHCHADLEPIRDRSPREGWFGVLRSSLESVLHLQPAIERSRHRLADYDLVILGTPVWFWDVASPVRTWVRRHRRGLHRVALFCTFGGSGHARALDDLERLCGLHAQARLALLEKSVLACQHDPALKQFLQDISHLPAASVSDETSHGQAAA